MDWKQLIELLTLIVLAATLVEIARTRRIDAQQKGVVLCATTVKVLPAPYAERGVSYEFHFDLADHNTTILVVRP